jgi:hypothetical protein
MLHENNERPIGPECADPTLKAFYSDLTEGDIELLQRGSRIVVNCQDTSCPNYPCAWSGLSKTG